jgi:hypothetical protein
MTAWATLVLAILALIAAGVAGAAWIVQARQLADLMAVNKKHLPVLEEQLPVLKEQLLALEDQRQELAAAAALRKREDRERHVQFVTRAYCWYQLSPPPSQAERAVSGERGREGVTYVRNTGIVPVYDIAFGLWTGGEMRLFRQYTNPLMPAEHAEATEATEQCSWVIPEDTDLETIKVAVFIRDAAQTRWRLRPGGHYDEYTDDMLPPGAWKTT